MDSFYVWLAVLVLEVAFAIFLFFNKKWVEQDWENTFYDHQKGQLRTYITLAQLKISRSPSGGITKLEEDVAMAQVSCEMSCVPQHQACITRSVVLSTLLKTSRARRRSCWQTAACCSSSALMRQTHSGSSGWTGG